jgi:lyso-ornithine lipid O-acyltransferase
MRILRASYRLARLFTVLAYYGAEYCLRPARRRTLRSRAQWLQDVCGAALRALNIRFESFGETPRQAAIAANHLSYLDILIFGAIAPTVFVAKSEVRGWPLFGWFARKAGTIFLVRGKRHDVARVSEEIASALASDVNVVVFLEGTSSDGAVVLPFKSSLLEATLRGGWAIQPAALSYSVPAGHSAEREVCWWGDMTLSPHLANLASIPTIHSYVAFGSPARGYTSRKDLAALLHRHVSQLHEGVRLLLAKSAEAPISLVEHR